MTTIAIKRSLTKSITNIILIVVVLFFGMWLSRNGNVGGVIISLCAGLTLTALIIELIIVSVNNRPKIIIDDEGLSAQIWGSNKIRWRDIQSARLEGMPRVGRFILIELHNGTKQSLPVEGLVLPPSAIYHNIQQHITQLLE